MIFYSTWQEIVRTEKSNVLQVYACHMINADGEQSVMWAEGEDAEEVYNEAELSFQDSVVQYVDEDYIVWGSEVSIADYAAAVPTLDDPFATAIYPSDR